MMLLYATWIFVGMLVYEAVKGLCIMRCREELDQAMPQDMDTVIEPHNIMDTMPDVVLFTEISNFLDTIGVYNCTLDVRPINQFQ